MEGKGSDSVSAEWLTTLLVIRVWKHYPKVGFQLEGSPPYWLLGCVNVVADSRDRREVNHPTGCWGVEEGHLPSPEGLM